MTTIVLADDHPIVRRGLRSLLEPEPDFSIVGEAVDGVTAIELTERLKPDVLVLDLKMPGLPGLEVLRQIRPLSPATHVVILSMYANELYVIEALQSGAMAYVLKESTADDLVHAIHEVISGRHYLSPPLSQRAIHVYVEKMADVRNDPYEQLTDRQRHVLYLAASGKTNAQIASQLFISPRTVETHRSTGMKKLGLSNQTELIRFFVEQQYWPAEDQL